jgi:hypothetical protein
LRILFGRKDSEGNVVPQLDIRQFRLTSDGGNYDVLSGTSMAAPMVTGGVAVLRAKYPDDSVEKLCARVTGSVLTLDSLSDYCLSGGIFRLDKAVAGETVPVPQSAYIEGKTLVVEGFFFGTKQGTLKVDGKKCTVKTWSEEKITANLPTGYTEGENRIEVTSGKRAGHGFFRLGTPKNLYPRLLLPGSTLSGEGEYQISESAREKYIDFYSGTPLSMYALSDSLYVFVQKLYGGTAVFRYKISEEQWDEVCVSDVCDVSSGIAAWNGRIYLTGTDAKNNKNYIGCFDPKKNELKWTLTSEGYGEDGVRLVNNGYGIFLLGGSRGIYGAPPQERESINSLRRLDPEKMEIRIIAEDVGANIGEFPLVSTLEDGTIIVVSG